MAPFQGHHPVEQKDLFQVAERRAEAEKLRSLQREVEALRAENLSLVASQAGAAQRADRAEDQLAALKAQVASLESELTSTRLELQAVEGTMAQVKVRRTQQNTV